MVDYIGYMITAVLMVVCIILIILVVKQESKTSGLSGVGGGGLSGIGSDSYWSKNKSRTKEGRLVKWTTICTIIFFVIALLLNSVLFNS